MGDHQDGEIVDASYWEDDELEPGEPDTLDDPPTFIFPSALPEKMSLGEILDLLQAADDGHVQLTTEEMKEIGARLALKADGYHEILETLELEEQRFKARVQDFKKAQKAAKRKREALEEIAVYHMKKHGFDRLPGADYVMRLKTTKSVFVKAEPSAALYMTLGEFMRVKYEWKKKEIGAALKAGNKTVAAVAEICEHVKPDFKVNKKVT